MTCKNRKVSSEEMDEMKDYAQSQCFNGLSLRFTLYHSAHRESSLPMKYGIGKAPQMEGG